VIFDLQTTYPWNALSAETMTTEVLPLEDLIVGPNYDVRKLRGKSLGSRFRTGFPHTTVGNARSQQQIQFKLKIIVINRLTLRE
jgi:hypothetical protein